MKYLPFFALLGLTLIACEAPTSTIDREADRASIAVANRSFSEYFIQGDTTRLGMLYTADAVLLPPGNRIQGRAGIRRYFAPRSSSTLLSHKLESESLVFQDSTAIDVGTWSNSWQVPDGEPRSSSERYLVIWRLEPDGQWRMAYDMWHQP